MQKNIVCGRCTGSGILYDVMNASLVNKKLCILIFLLAVGVTCGSAEVILSDSCDVNGGNSPGTGFGPDGSTAGMNYQLSSRLSGTAAAGVSYWQSPAGVKAASSYSIKSNKINVALAAGAGRFSFTTDGTTPLDLGVSLGIPMATPVDPVVYELSAKISNKSTGIARTSFGLASADGGIQAWNLGIQFVKNGADLDLYRRVDSGSNPTGTDYNDGIATLPGQAGAEVDLKLRITDAGAESGVGKFNSGYEVFANGVSVYTSAKGDFRFEGSATRLVLFDTAPSAGPVTYDAFALNLVSATNNPPGSTNLPLSIISHRMTTAGFELVWNSQAGTNYSVLKCTNLDSKNWVLTTNLTGAGTNTTITDTAISPVASYYFVAQLAQSGLAITNATATQRAGLGLVDIYYNLSDAYSGSASVSVLISTDGGLTYHAPAASFSGDVGAGINPGSNRHIVWNVGADWSAVSASNVRIKIVADRKTIGTDMALIPAGAFNMGNAMAEGLACESPVHSVNIAAFYMERHEVTRDLWLEVMQWGTNHGYSFEHLGVAAVTNHPIQQISWYDAVKWCNARSEKEGLPPAYFMDKAWTVPYRTGEVDLTEANVHWSGAGYRLPTEAEWEKAARGGLQGKRFAAGDTLTQTQANYWSTDFESFDVNGVTGPHPLAPEFPNVLPIGSFLPTGYGLYDMAGNIWEWCWDYYGDSWYSDPRASSDNTHGPSTASWGGDRVYRGGAGVDIAWKSRVANRADAPPRFAMGHFGFRVVMPAGEQLDTAESQVLTLTP
jgi:formylglycine-generating enzyme required for sulfatase activity